MSGPTGLFPQGRGKKNPGDRKAAGVFAFYGAVESWVECGGLQGTIDAIPLMQGCAIASSPPLLPYRGVVVVMKAQRQRSNGYGQTAEASDLAREDLFQPVMRRLLDLADTRAADPENKANLFEI